MINVSISEELLKLNQRLLDSIVSSNWEVYEELCDPGLTAFEPEALGQLVVGMQFHRFYFDLRGAKSQVKATMCSPQIRVMGDVAIIAYVRLNQRATSDGANPTTSGYEETRIWQRQNGKWKHVHFHRSRVPTQ